MLAWATFLEAAPAGLAFTILTVYGLLRLADKIAFLVGLRVVLRETPRTDRIAALKAYISNSHTSRN